MKKTFLRTISPITLIVNLLLDAAVIAFTVFSVKQLIYSVDIYTVIFSICVIFAIVVAALLTKNVTTQGIIFREEELEFTHIDEENIFRYDEIISVETEKDTKASLVKNFSDRQSKIIFHLKENKIVTVDIGLTTKKTLKKAEEKIKSFIEA